MTLTTGQDDEADHSRTGGQMTTTTDHDALVEIAKRTLDPMYGQNVTLRELATAVIDAVTPIIERRAQVEVLEAIVAQAKEDHYGLCHWFKHPPIGLEGVEEWDYEAVDAPIADWLEEVFAALTAPAQTEDAPHDTEVGQK